MSKRDFIFVNVIMEKKLWSRDSAPHPLSSSERIISYSPLYDKETSVITMILTGKHSPEDDYVFYRLDNSSAPVQKDIAHSDDRNIGIINHQNRLKKGHSIFVNNNAQFPKKFEFFYLLF